MTLRTRHCAYSDILAIERRVQELQLETPIDQSRLFALF